jgi:hypothetical protein
MPVHTANSEDCSSTDWHPRVVPAGPLGELEAEVCRNASISILSSKVLFIVTLQAVGERRRH